MNKAIVLHDRHSNEPMVIRTGSIDAIRKVFDKIPDLTGSYSEEYSEIIIGSCSYSVKETIGIVITKINQVESEEQNGNISRCEESQRVCSCFREKGHEAYSCDIVECSGDHPEWHIKGDVLPILNGYCEFKTMDGVKHQIWNNWDMVIAFPPCTHLAVSGAAWFEKKRADGRQRDGIEFFCKFFNIDCNKVCIENPIGIISGDYIPKWFPELAEKYGLPHKPSQVIQPWQFGHPYTKSTCLWLKGLPELKPTDILEKPKEGWVNQSFTPDGRYGGFKSFNGSKQRSKTFMGVAKAMAEQWG